MKRMRHARFLVLLIAVFQPTVVGAQQLPLKREVPSVSWAGCPQPEERRSTVTPAQRQDAERLAETATQASLLGDKAAALDLLTRAADADPTSRRIAYNLARALDELERPRDALAAYCRYLALAPDAADAQEVRERARALGTPPGFAVAAPAVRAHESGIASFDAGNLAAADTAFGQAIEAAPDWSAAVYNRAVVRLAQGRTDAAGEDFRRFLELSPGAPEFSAVLDLLATFRQPTPQLYNPSGALVRGLLVPGLGQMTTGRLRTGIVYLGASAGIVAAGLLVKRLEVDCLSPPVNGRCPAGQVANQQEKRPYLLPALALALAIDVYGAIDAYRGARRRNSEAARSSRIGPDGRVGNDGRKRGPALALPAINVGLHDVRIDLLRVRF
jgi:tetratricopeptide (TPR) repeat protein